MNAPERDSRIRNTLAWAADLLDGLVTWLSDLAGRIRGKAGEL